MTKLPPIDVFGTLSDVVETIPQLLWRPSINFAFDAEEPTRRRLTRLQKAWAISRSAHPDATLEEFLDMANTCMPEVSQAMATHLYRLIADLALQNTILFDRPDYDLGRSLTEEESAFIISQMGDLQTRLDNESRLYEIFKAALVEMLIALVSRLPPTADTTSNLTVPLYALASKELVLAAYYLPFILAPATPDPIASLATSRTRAVLQDNALQASHLSLEEAERHPHRIKWPTAALSSEEVVTSYLTGTPFYDFLQTSVPFVISRRAYGEHGALFAKSGHGKTQTLRAIVSAFLQEDDPPALFIMDSLGSLIEGVDQLEVFATRLKDRLVIIDPADPTPPALNFFKIQSDDLCFYLFKAIDQSFTPRQATMISYLMELMRHIDGATLLTLIEVCESRKNPYPQAVQKLSPFAQSFFDNQFYANKPDQLVQQTKSQIANRIYTLGRMPKFQQMFSAPDNKFDPYQCMQEKKIVLINTDARSPRLGGLGDASAILGRFILAQCLDAARARPKNERHLALLVVDEAKHYMDDQAALILSDARQFGLGLLLATQFPHQLEEAVRREINTNTSIKMMGPVEYAVASQYARDMFTTPEFIMGMKSYDHSHAEWATHVANLTDRALKLSVPFGAIEKMPRMDESTHVALRGAIRRNRRGSTNFAHRPDAAQGPQRAAAEPIAR